MYDPICRQTFGYKILAKYSARQVSTPHLPPQQPIRLLKPTVCQAFRQSSSQVRRKNIVSLYHPNLFILFVMFDGSIPLLCALLPAAVWTDQPNIFSPRQRRGFCRLWIGYNFRFASVVFLFLFKVKLKFNYFRY